ncbi:unnamed protein product [Lymnaea stagnalis]|uniref:Uncharacterized protein n=1 Tax=Lymnaea stagnalis TaxID=6523 RepID=A0AAV2I062_LYMST
MSARTHQGKARPPSVALSQGTVRPPPVALSQGTVHPTYVALSQGTVRPPSGGKGATTSSPEVMIVGFLALAVLTCCSASGMESLGKFCITYLKQSADDAAVCQEKPNTYSIGVGDRAILSYLCCLGYFRDVTFSYMEFISTPLLLYIARLRSDDDLMNIARFVTRCSWRVAGSAPLTVDNFSFWRATGSCWW